MGVCEDAPDEYCGHVLKPEVAGTDAEMDDWWHKRKRNAVCLRKPKYDGLCVWHADTDKKTAEELVESRLTPDDVPGEPNYAKEHLNGAILRGIEFPDDFSFGGCVLMRAGFPDAYLGGAEFPDADLRNAKFPGANLQYAKFPDANLSFAEFPDASLVHAKFLNANLRGAEFPDAFLGGTGFPDAYLGGAEFPDAELQKAEFLNANLRKAEFPDANLRKAEFPDANLRKAEFSSTNLRGANLVEADLQAAKFSDADLQDAAFRPVCTLTPLRRFRNDQLGASLEDAQFEDGTDLRGADLSGARLYQTAFRDARINDETEFGIDDENFYGTVCRYEYDERTGVSINDQTSRLEAAAWTHRRLESLFKENAMDERARNAHIRKQEAQRAYYEEQMEDNEWVKEREFPPNSWFKSLGQYSVATLNWHLHRHGESLRQLLKVSALLIIGCGLLYPLVGGIDSTHSGGPYQITSLNEFSGPEAWGEIANGLYFSAITFTTIGYGDFYPAGIGSRILVALESLAGALLIALFVFVIGRRVAR